MKRDTFLLHLADTYGEWDKNSSRFGTFSYGDIANDLCISASQFSKLLYGTATDGMYERSTKNIEQISLLKQLKEENKELTEQVNLSSSQISALSTDGSFNYKYLAIGALVIIGLTYFLTSIALSSAPEVKQSSRHSLALFFEREFASDHVSPFLSIRDAQSFCPGSAYEGIWGLERPYIIPIPMKKPGLYYVAKKSDVRMKCSRNVAPELKGKVLYGFEDMIHELWIDTRREPLAPKYFNTSSKSYTKAFYNIDFEGDPSFRKLATIRAFMFNTFEIDSTEIIRKGEPSGRFAEEIDHSLVEKYEVDIKDVLENIVGNMVKTECSPAINTNCNPNTLKENESTIKYDCHFKINNENLGLGGSYPYSKTFKLIKQNYSDNLLCDCKS